MRPDLPPPLALRRALYQGEILQLPPSPASLQLCQMARAALAQAFPGLEPRRAHAILGPAETLTQVAEVRRALRGPAFHAAAAALLGEVGFLPAGWALDCVRLRAILPGGHHDPRAAPAYAVHRDTWYGSPQAQINWWLPLHDVRAEQSVYFLPDYLTRPVPNDSERFDYDGWVRRVGWQRQTPPRDAVYPATTLDLGLARRVGVAGPAGTVVIFAAAQLHGTSRIEDCPAPDPLRVPGWARFSVDFRSVYLPDHEAGVGAPNVDCRCAGSALVDYQRLAP